MASFAFRRLFYHVQSPGLRRGTMPRYSDYLAAALALRDKVSVNCTLCDLDAYLWIAGQRMVWKPRSESPSRLNSDVDECFNSPTREQGRLLASLDLHILRGVT